MKPQCTQLLDYLKTGESITVLDAMQHLQIYALSQRAGELRRAGWPVISELERTPSGKHIARYKLIAV